MTTLLLLALFTFQTVQLHQVNKIYIGNMGTADEAERFRMLLDKQLTDKGFVVVDSEEKADATLSGALSVRLRDNGDDEARVTVQLKTRDGARIWDGEFGLRFVNPYKRTEPVKRRAEDVANGLRSDWKKSAKKAGIKVDK